MARTTTTKTTDPAPEVIFPPDPAPADLLEAVERGARPFLRITGPEKGRRRADRRFGPDPVDIAVTELTEAEILWLQRDPLLTISYGLLDAADAGEGAGGQS